MARTAALLNAIQSPEGRRAVRRLSCAGMSAAISPASSDTATILAGWPSWPGSSSENRGAGKNRAPLFSPFAGWNFFPMPGFCMWSGIPWPWPPAFKNANWNFRPRAICLTGESAISTIASTWPITYLETGERLAAQIPNYLRVRFEDIQADPRKAVNGPGGIRPAAVYLATNERRRWPAFAPRNRAPGAIFPTRKNYFPGIRWQPGWVTNEQFLNTEISGGARRTAVRALKAVIPLADRQAR